MGHTKKKEANNIDIQGESNSFPMLRIVFMFNSGFRCLSKFAFKCSIRQQRYGNSSSSTCSLDFKLTTKPGTTDREHGNLSTSRRCVCLGTEYSFYCVECYQFFRI